MNYPSITQFISKSTNTFRRFPFAILVSILGVYYAIQSFNYASGNDSEFDHLLQTMMTCAIGLPLFVAIALFMERRQTNWMAKTIFSLVASGLLFWYYFVNKGQYLMDDLVRFWVLNAAMHFIVAFAPFIGKKEINGFWQFNKTLFLRFIVSAIYIGVLFAGLSIALVAIDNLLGVHIPEKYYMRLWIVMAGIFNTWFFLSGVPENFEELNESDDYPKGLKIFTQYVLLPLVTIYLIILYLYIGKILIKFALPHGWTSLLVICFSTVGVLSLLLIYPIKEKEENKWMMIYSRGFYLALFPLIILMFVSIVKRVTDYGITEDRYYVILLACWLTIIAFYFTFSKAKNIKIIPTSLALICLISLYGPWSASSISIHSQFGRLVTALAKENLIKDHKIIKTEKFLEPKAEEHISNQIEYLVRTHGVKSIQPLFTENLDTLIRNKNGNSRSRYMDSYSVENIIRVKYLSELPYTPEPVVEADTTQATIKKRMTIEVENMAKSSINIGGYDYLFFVDEYSSSLNANNVRFEVALENGKKVKIRTLFNKTNGTLEFIDESSNSCSFNLTDFVSRKRKSDYKNYEADDINFRAYPNDSMIMRSKCSRFSMKLNIKSMEVGIKEHAIEVDRISANALFRFR